MQQKIRLINGSGETRVIRRQARMNVTSHSSVLEAISARASRFDGPNRGGLGNACPMCLVDETGTLYVSLLDVDKQTGILQQETSELNSILVPDEVLQVHGRGDGTPHIREYQRAEYTDEGQRETGEDAEATR